ncbi:MAG: hypothetical protein ACXWP5_02295 [Bdellovibrionota bacterium]
MKSWSWAIALVLISAATGASVAWGAPDLRAEKVHAADSKKNKFYIRDGLFVGGDRAVDDVTVKDIRHATNQGFERIVIDLQGNRDGEPTAISRPPYYQVSVTPDERRMVFTLWGKPKLGFNARKVLAGFRKSSAIEKVELLPHLEENSWTFVLELKGVHPVEVFELGDPVRVILDVQTARR